MKHGLETLEPWILVITNIKCLLYLEGSAVFSGFWSSQVPLGWWEGLKLVKKAKKKETQGFLYHTGLNLTSKRNL